MRAWNLTPHPVVVIAVIHLIVVVVIVVVVIIVVVIVFLNTLNLLSLIHLLLRGILRLQSSFGRSLCLVDHLLEIFLPVWHALELLVDLAEIEVLLLLHLPHPLIHVPARGERHGELKPKIVVGYCNLYLIDRHLPHNLRLILVLVLVLVLLALPLWTLHGPYRPFRSSTPASAGSAGSPCSSCCLLPVDLGYEGSLSQVLRSIVSSSSCSRLP
mmetsp:Transcript_42339/g.133398  ORF Transcript_42339/g.133398 Transcript_42339/m.133398 type:complete len:214 (+) Transcript_42339:2003-2644(+)